MLTDAGLAWGGDLTPSSTGDIALVSGNDLSQQRVVRRLLTNPQDYIWQPSYGAGLGQFVGAAVSQKQIFALIRSQIFEEASVGRRPEPGIAANQSADGSIIASISYSNNVTNSRQSLTFTLGG